MLVRCDCVGTGAMATVNESAFEARNTRAKNGSVSIVVVCEEKRRQVADEL